MVSIIRSPKLSDQKHALAPRRAADSTVPPTASNAPSAIVTRLAAAPQGGAESAAESERLAALVQQARETVLTQLKEEAESARELAQQRGLQEGRQAGLEEAKQGFAGELARIRALADNLQQSVGNGIQGLEDLALSIAFEAVCKLLGDKAFTRETVLALVRQASVHAANHERVAIRLYPADLAMLRDAGVLTNASAGGVQVSCIEDPSLASGGCVVEVDGGELDARLDTQLARLRETLLLARGQGED